MTTSIPSSSPDAATNSSSTSLNARLGGLTPPAQNGLAALPAGGAAASFDDLLGSSSGPLTQTAGQTSPGPQAAGVAGDSSATGGTQTLQQMLSLPSTLLAAGVENVFNSTQPGSAAGPVTGGTGPLVPNGSGIVATLAKSISARAPANNPCSDAPGDAGEATPELAPGIKRDVAEAIAALLAPLYAALPAPPVTSAALSADSAAINANGQAAAGSANTGVADVTVDFSNGTSLRLELPMGPADAPDFSSLSAGIAAAIDRAMAPGGQTAPNGAALTAATKTAANVILQTTIAWPDANTAAAASGQAAAANAADGGGPQNPAASDREIFAGGSPGTLPGLAMQNSARDINFLKAASQMVTKSKKDSGISVALPGATMPTTLTSRRLTVEPLVFAPDPTAREIVPTVPLTATSSVPLSTTGTSQTPAPLLAHRAVDTILNVVESQADRSNLGGTVNLNFNFGGDNLTVRVQMRGSEVQTSFLTDSTELRAALSTEWHAATGPGTAAAGLHLLEPVFSSPTASSAPASAGTGSGAPGQQSSSQQNPQQQGRTSAALPELPTLRRGAASATPAEPESSRPVRMPSPNSLHLAAVA